MKVLIRTDASRALGSGHVMRELALADTLRNRGAAVEFACRTLDGHAARLVSAAGFTVQELSLHDNSDEEQDVAATRYAARGAYDWVVVDHYDLAATWERQARGFARNVLVIDDLANRAHDCDLLVDQNLYADAERRYDARVPPTCARLLGPAYALLRPEFHAARAGASPRSGHVERLHVSFGGTDPARQTLLALEALARMERPELRSDIIIGPGNSDRALIEAAASRIPGADCHVAPNDIARLMARADLALGSGGVSTNERMCLGLPAAVVATSPLQDISARDVARAGGHRYLGLATKLDAHDYAAALVELTGAPETLRAMSETGMRIVDGKGTERVAQRMHEL